MSFASSGAVVHPKSSRPKCRLQDRTLAARLAPERSGVPLLIDVETDFLCLWICELLASSLADSLHQLLRSHWPSLFSGVGVDTTQKILTMIHLSEFHKEIIRNHKQQGLPNPVTVTGAACGASSPFFLIRRRHRIEQDPILTQEGAGMATGYHTRDAVRCRIAGHFVLIILLMKMNSIPMLFGLKIAHQKDDMI